MNKKAITLILLLTLFILSACVGSDNGVISEALALPIEQIGGEPSTTVDSDLAENSLGLTLYQDRLIIRTGSLSIIVEDTDETLKMIAELAEAQGGWTVSSNVFESGSAKRGTITIRVPADDFEQTVAAIKTSAIEVPSEFTESQDVTEDYIDLDARLTNLESTADRVRTFLEDARNVEEALAVNQELSRLESEIEVIKGRIQYLGQSAAFSTISIEVTPDELNQPIEVAGWRPEGTVRSAIEALLNTLQSAASVLMWMVIYCLPLLIIFGLPAFLAARYGYRRWQRRGQVYAEMEEE